VAILLAARHFELLGVTTVGGNSPIENVTANALKVLELGEIEGIPVARGAERPLLRDLRTAPSVHGPSGLDGAELPAPVTAIDPRRAVEFLIDTLMSDEAITLFATGPLTNVAMALRLEPRIAQHLSEISLMGGSADWGNASPSAEFNTWVDPESAHIVFTSGVPLVMCGLNLTRQASVGVQEVARAHALGNRTGAVVGALLESYRAATDKLTGTGTVPLHDPCAVAAVMNPELFEFAETNVSIELRGQHTYGMTVVDQRFLAGKDPAGLALRAGAPAPNCRVAMTINRGKFFDLVFETLGTYP
jgi:pyrimidine-specific ribonucleoside hydrolase